MEQGKIIKSVHIICGDCGAEICRSITKARGILLPGQVVLQNLNKNIFTTQIK